MAQIIIADASPTVQYTIGSTPTTVIGAIPFPYFSTGDIKVYFDGTLKTLTTHYTISGTAVEDGFSGGTVTAAENQSNITVTVDRDVAIERTTDFPAAGVFNIATLNITLDKIFAILQWLETAFVNSVKRPTTSTETYSLAWPDGADSTAQYVMATTSGLSLSAAAGTQWLGGNGSVGAPYYSFTSDTNSGLFRVGSDQLGWSVNGVKGLDLSTTGLTVTGTLAATAITGSGILSIDATTESTSGTTGSIHTDGGLGVAKKLHVVGVATHGGDILSDTDSTDSLGSTGVRWLKLWVDSIQTTANTDIAGDLTVTGNLTVNGTTVTNDATNTEIKDPLIEINSGAGSTAHDLGLLMERGSTGDNAFLGWDESGDYFVAATTTAVGSSTGNITYSFAPFKCSAITATSGTLAGITSLGLNAGATITAGILDEDAMGSDSAVALATQQSIKAYVDSSSKAAGISMTWETATTDTDQGVGKVWANNATLSSASVLYFDDVERNSVSINALIDTLDDPTATNSATIYIQEAGTASAGVLFKVSGAVTSASTYSKVAVTHQATFGTLSDGDIVGVTFAFSGDDGDDGAGSGTVTQINAGDGFSFSAITTTGTIAVDGNLQDLDALGAVSANSEMIVGTGSGAYAYESGATLRTSIGCPALAAVNTFSKAQSGSITALSDGTNISVDLSLNNHFSVTLAGNRTLDNPTNIVAGTSGSIFITQDGSGSRTLAYGSYYDFAAGTAPTLTTTAAKIDRIDYIARTTTSLHCVFTGDLS